MVRKWSIEDFRHMSVDERLDLISELWNTLDEGDATADMLTDEEKKELERRLAQSERYPDAGSSWDEVVARIRKRQS